MTTSRDEPGFRAGAAFLAAGVALTAVYFALPAGGIAASLVYEGIGAGAALATVWGIRLHRPQSALPWILFTLGNLSSVAGDVLYDVFPDAASPSAADAFYLAAYPLLAAGLLLLLVRAGGHHRLAAVTEAGVAMVALALLQWVFVMRPALAGEGAAAARAVNATYPAGDLVLLAGFTGFFVSPAWRRPAFGLLVAAVVAMVVGDELYNVNPNGYAVGDALDATWLLSYVLFGAAALHPSMRELERSRRSATLRVSPSRIALLTAALLTPAAVLLAQWARGAPLEVPAVFAAALAISLLVVWRLTGILRALERLRLRERAARSEAVEARERLAEQNERLLEADRLKDEFVALVSHDLRTPLTSIIGYTELALEETDEPLDDERRSYLAVVARSSERLLRLVDDLLFVARLQAGSGLELEPAELDLAVVAAQAVTEAQPRALAKDVRVACSGAVSAPVVADRGRMFQLLDNLIANAVKFTPSGGSVDVEVEARDGVVAIEVRDTGIGFADGEVDRLFEPFFRTEAASRAQVPGTGLGLFIARVIADAHRGTLGARQRPEGGAAFRFELPRHVAGRRKPPDEAELVA